MGRECLGILYSERLHRLLSHMISPNRSGCMIGIFFFVVLFAIGAIDTIKSRKWKALSSRANLKKGAITCSWNFWIIFLTFSGRKSLGGSEHLGWPFTYVQLTFHFDLGIYIYIYTHTYIYIFIRDKFIDFWNLQKGCITHNVYKRPSQFTKREVWL